MGDEGSGPGSGTAALRRYGWFPLLALSASLVAEQGERLSLSHAIDPLKAEFGVGDTSIGLLFTGMSVVGGLAALPFGWLADRTRRTYLLAGAMAIWTLAMGLGALATTFALLFATRILVGFVEANGPAGVSLLADYYPSEQRAKFFGLYQSGALLGAIIGLGAGGIIVDRWGWEGAFLMWIPVGLIAMVMLLFAPEPDRGLQDEALADEHLDAIPHPGTDIALAGVAGGEDERRAVERLEGGLEADAALAVAARSALPPPPRTGALDYDRANMRDVLRELWQIRTMWMALLALIISNFLLGGLQAWGVEFFKRVHDLGPGGASALTGVMGGAAGLGIFMGGILSDRYLKRGILNARINVVIAANVGATAFLIPAFAIPNLIVTIPFLFLGGMCITLPVAPSEAVVTDVVVAQLRGRAAGLRSIIRSVASVGPFLLGALSDAIGLRPAIVALCPLFLVSAGVMIVARRTYQQDLAFVVHETRRVQTLRNAQA